MNNTPQKSPNAPQSSARVHQYANAYLQDKLGELQTKRKIADFRSGDLINVYTTVAEGNRERLQQFQGRCINISRGHSGLDASYTVWAVIDGIGVRRVFPMYAYDVEVVRKGRVRRKKLTYLTQLRGKAARIRDRS